MDLEYLSPRAVMTELQVGGCPSVQEDAELFMIILSCFHIAKPEKRKSKLDTHIRKSQP